MLNLKFSTKISFKENNHSTLEQIWNDRFTSIRHRGAQRNNKMTLK